MIGSNYQGSSALEVKNGSEFRVDFVRNLILFCFPLYFSLISLIN